MNKTAKDKILELLKRAKLEKKEAELLEKKGAELLEKKAELLKKKEAELLEKEEAELLEKTEAELLKIKEDIKEAFSFSKALGTLEEAKQELDDRGSQQTRSIETSIDKDGIYLYFLYQYGNILYGVKEYGRALKYYEEIVEREHDVKAYKALGDCLRKLNLYDKAFKQYKTALEKCNGETSSADKAAVFNSRGLNYIARAISNSYGATLYTSKIDKKKALKDFEKAIEISDDPNPLYHCNKGIALYTLGRKKEGSDSFETAEQLVKNGRNKELTKQNLNYIKEPLLYFMELERKVEEIQTKFEEIQNKLNTLQFQQELQKDFNRQFLGDYKSFQKKYNKLVELVNSNVLKQEAFTKFSEIGREELTKKMNEIIADLQDQLDQLNNNLQKVEKRIEIAEEDIADIKHEMKTIYSDLSKKLQDYDKVLEEYLGKQTNLTEIDKANIKEYYKAFVGTIAAAYITAQVVASGKVELEKPLKFKLLSAVFSVIPVVGEAASKGVELASIPISSLISCISSIGEKVWDEAVGTGIHKTRKGKAKNIMQLATDSIGLSKQVSDAAIQIVTNTDKQKQIRNITPEYLNKQPGKALQKMKEFCNKIGQKYDKALHDEVYSKAAALLGKKDAKNLIKQYPKYTIDKSPQDGFEEAVQVIMKDYVSYVVDIVKIREEVSKGSCTQELRDLFSTNYLENKLKISLKKDTISDQEIEEAQMITFKYMCKAVKEDQNKNNAMACVKEFVKITQYKDIVKKVADKHPEYCCTKEIAKLVIPEKRYWPKWFKK